MKNSVRNSTDAENSRRETVRKSRQDRVAKRSVGFSSVRKADNRGIVLNRENKSKGKGLRRLRKN
jgi:hypothetical protein